MFCLIFHIETFLKGKLQVRTKDSTLNLPYVRFRFELYDYDPNQEDLYEDKSIGELEEMISSLDNEEEDAIFAIKEKYLKLHEMYSRYRELKRPEQNSSCPDISGYKSINDQNLCLK